MNKFISKPFNFAAILASLSLTACVVGPDYVSPSANVPDKWHNAMDTPQKLSAAELATWWKSFNDPLLSQLIDRSMSGNFDLKKALAQIKQAQAQQGVANAVFFPQINSQGSAGENYSGTTDKRNPHYTLGLNASWQIDLFGGIARSVESAQANVEASEFGYQAVQVTLVSQIGLNYVQMRTFQARLKVAEQNLAAQENIHKLTYWRWQAGTGNKLDEEQALSSVEQLRAQIPNLKNQIAQNQHQIALLLGVPAGSLNAQLNAPQPIPNTGLKIAIGIPADVLRQRPDIRQAERQLAAQTAQIGVATAALYPKLTLSGSIGLDVIKASNMFTTAGLIDSLLGQLTFPIFNAGSIRQNINVQNALQEQALASYETTVLTALKEVENALVGIAQTQQNLQNLDKAVKAAERAMALAQSQYQAGLIDFQNVWQTQRNLLSLQDQYRTSQGQISNYMINLYTALGGGWKSLS